MFIALILLSLWSWAPEVSGQLPAGLLAEEERKQAEEDLRRALAGPRELAFRQILAEVRILRAEPDTAIAYDLVIHFDPERYRHAQVGIYPFHFEDQLIAWGKRISLYTRSVPWASSRFFLRDISTAREAWIFTADTHLLYKPEVDQATKLSADWLEIIHAVDARTAPRLMSRWLRLIHDESREQLGQRTRTTRP